MSDSIPVGRNEPCPCGSKKKYKRCCGINAAPKLSVPKVPTGPDGQAFDPAAALGGMDPAMMAQMGQMLRQLPKGQMQRLQAIMSKAMHGKDVTEEAQEFERTLPVEFQQMMQSFQMPGLPGVEGTEAETPLPGLAGTETEVAPTEAASMTEEQARALVAEAAAAGKISQEQADGLLAPQESSRFGKFWKNLSGKRDSSGVEGAGR